MDASASPQSEPQGSSEQRGQTQELPMNTLQQVLGAALDSAKLQASATAVISQDCAANLLQHLWHMHTVRHVPALIAAELTVARQLRHL